MKNMLPHAVAGRSETARKANATRKRLKGGQSTQAETEATCKVIRKLFAGMPQTFQDGDAVKYVAPDGMLGPFTVGIADDGSVRLWFRQPGRPCYAEGDWGDHVHAIVEKGETFPGTDIVMEGSRFTTMGPDTDINTSCLLKIRSANQGGAVVPAKA